MTDPEPPNLKKRKRVEPQPTQRPKSILASSLVAPNSISESKQGVKYTSIIQRGNKPCLRTGWGRKLDEHALHGGIAGVTSVAVEQSEWEFELTYDVLVEHLISSSNAVAFIITSPSSFSVLRLYKLLCERIRDRSRHEFVHGGTFMYRQAKDVEPLDTKKQIIAGKKKRNSISDTSENSPEQEAKRILLRVHLMPVFDFQGCLEAVDEVRERLSPHSKSFPHDLKANEHKHGEPSSKALSDKEEHENKESPTSKIIADSQAPSPISDIGEDLELAPRPAGEQSISLQTDQLPQPQNQPPTLDIPTPADSRLDLLILSNLPQLISPVMRRNHVRGHAHLVSMLRTLRHLSSQGDLVSIIFNNTVGHKTPLLPQGIDSPRESSTGRADKDNPATGSTRDMYRRRRSRANDACVVPSVFSDNGDVRPALGKTLGYFVDVQMLVTAANGPVALEEAPVAVTERGVRRVDGLEGNGDRVLEVLWDKHGMRTGRWGVLGR